MRVWVASKVKSSWTVSGAISRSRKHGVTIFFHLSKLHWSENFMKSFIRKPWCATRHNGRPNCLPCKVFAGSEAKEKNLDNNDKSSRKIPGLPNIVSPRIAAARQLESPSSKQVHFKDFQRWWSWWQGWTRETPSGGLSFGSVSDS